MPFLLLLLGIVMLMAAINGRHKELGDLWLSQVQGPNNFLNILFVLLLLAGMGSISALRPLAIAFMGLLLLVLVLTNSGTEQSVSLIGRARAQLLGGS